MKNITIVTFILVIIFNACSNIVDKKMVNGNNIESIIQQKLNENDGWFQGIIGDSIYNTIGNATKIFVDKEIKRGWEFVGYYSSDNYEKLDTYNAKNLSIFRKKVPAFFSLANPWKFKQSKPWLPILDYIIKNENKIQLTKSLGHNCPTIIRRQVCECGNSIFFITEDDNKIKSRCTKCQRTYTVWDTNDVYVDKYNSKVIKSTEQVYKIEYSIEYSVDSENGEEFSWILVELIDDNWNRFVLLDGETD